MQRFEINKAFSYLTFFFIVFVAGFSISSGRLSLFLRYFTDWVISNIEYAILYHSNTLQIYRDAMRYFLLPKGWYLKLHTEGFSSIMILPILLNALFNSLFQPIFLCAFTPQVVLNYMVFPFFIYGTIRYFKKVSLMILFFLLYCIYIGISGSVTEPLIRHRLACELIYLLIGLAGFESWITRRSS